MNITKINAELNFIKQNYIDSAEDKTGHDNALAIGVGIEEARKVFEAALQESMQDEELIVNCDPLHV